MFALLNRLLENVVARTLLSAAIVISLVPHAWMHANDAWFLVLFGPEFVARALLAFREEAVPRPLHVRPKTGWRRPRTGELLLLGFDLLALASFLPIGTIVETGRWLRLFRLSRTLLLLRYWAPIVRDLGSVVSRPERRRQLALVMGSLLTLTFGGAVLLDHLTDAVGDDFDGDGTVGDTHDHEFLVRMWWAFRQLEDPGNLLGSPHDTGTLIVSVALTLAGLFVVSFIIGVGTDIVTELTAVSRLRPPGLRRHTVLVNLGERTQGLLQELMGEERKLLPGARGFPSRVWFSQLLRNVRRGRDFVVVTRDSHRPDFLHAPEFSRVVHRAWDDDDDDTLLLRGDITEARRVVLLSDTESGVSDEPNIRTLVTVVERLRETGTTDGMQRKLITEIMAEDNVAGASRAASRAPDYLSPTVVPTERLLARFLACVARRQGVAGVLTQLLSSDGSELYTYDYGYADRDRTLPERAPDLGDGPARAMDTIANRARTDAARRRIVPIGLLSRGDGGPRVLLNPTADTEIDGELTGFFVVAPHFELVSAFAARLAQSRNPAAETPSTAPPMSVQPATPLRRVVVCGFRSASTALLESLFGAEPDAEILLLVADESSRRRARALLDAHGKLASRGLVPERYGRFEAKDDGTMSWVPVRGRAGAGTLRVEVADWTATECLADLPGGFGCVADLDLLLFVSDDTRHEDARTTTALMKVEDLCFRLGLEAMPRVVAEVDDPELATRLTRRYAAMERAEVHVFSGEALRSLLMFQAIVVPHFAEIYEELMAPWGQSLVGLDPEGSGRVGFDELAAALRAEGKILVAVDRRRGSGREITMGHGDQRDEVELGSCRLWVIQPDA